MNKHGQSFKVGPPSEHQSSSHIYNITVSPNASSSLDAALSTGLASYNPLSTTTLYFASGRNQITTNSKVIPAILAVINPILTKAAIQHTAAFLGANTANTTALTAAERCPQCLAAPFAISEIDLRPFDVAPATGTTMVGMIFVRGPPQMSLPFSTSIPLTLQHHSSCSPSHSPSSKSSAQPARSSVRNWTSALHFFSAQSTRY